jgi:hypothetical protein
MVQPRYGPHTFFPDLLFSLLTKRCALHPRSNLAPGTAYAGFVLFCNLALPCILFYVLKNHTHMTLRELIGISSATLGVSSSFDGPFRTWKCESCSLETGGWVQGEKGWGLISPRLNRTQCGKIDLATDP